MQDDEDSLGKIAFHRLTMTTKELQTPTEGPAEHKYSWQIFVTCQNGEP
jgi:hypothetical protein